MMIVQTPTAHLPIEGVIAATRYQSPRQFAGSSGGAMPGRTPSWPRAPDGEMTRNILKIGQSLPGRSPGTTGASYGCGLGPRARGRERVEKAKRMQSEPQSERTEMTMKKLLAATMSVVAVFSLSATVGVAQTSCPAEVAS